MPESSKVRFFFHSHWRLAFPLKYMRSLCLDYLPTSTRHFIILAYFTIQGNTPGRQTGRVGMPTSSRPRPSETFSFEQRQLCSQPGCSQQQKPFFCSSSHWSIQPVAYRHAPKDRAEQNSSNELANWCSLAPPSKEETWDRQKSDEREAGRKHTPAIFVPSP